MAGWPGVIGVLLAVGCSGVADPSREPSPDPDLGPGQTDLAVGESARVGAVDIRFLGVTQDSRCAIDVICVWAGNAAVELEVSTAEGADRIVLNSFVEPRSLTLDGVIIRLVQVRPQPVSTRRIDPGDYVVRVEISLLDEG